MKRDIRIIALDMDGTLLNGNNEISLENKRAIDLAVKKGIHVIISTGRPLASIKPYIHDLGLQSYSVTVNGGQVWDDKGNLISEKLLEPDQVKAMTDLIHTHNIKHWAVTTEGYFTNNIPADINVSDYDWLKIGFEINDDRLRDRIRNKLQYINVEITNSSPVNLEINQKGVSKGNALRTICKKLNFSMDQVMAVGDSLNDMSMIQKAGVGIAMGNAQEIVKNAADWITETNEKDGVAKAIRHWVL